MFLPIHRRKLGIWSVIAVVMAPTSVCAQKSLPRGFFQLEIGKGAISIPCAQCRRWDGDNALTGEASIGVDLTRAIGLVIHAGGAMKLSRIHGFASWTTYGVRIRPTVSQSFVLDASVGSAHGKLRVPDRLALTPPEDWQLVPGLTWVPGETLVDRTETVVQAGAAFELVLARKFALTPKLTVMGGPVRASGLSLGVQLRLPAPGGSVASLASRRGSDRTSTS